MPTVHEHFAAVHLPKTGGTWLRRVLWDRGGKPRQGQHDPASRLHYHHREGRVVLGTVREPGAWYLSLYEHARREDATDRWLREWGGGSIEWADVLYGWTHTEERRSSRPGVIWEEMGEDDMARPCGLWTAAVLWAYTGPDSWAVDLVMDTASLERAVRGLGIAGDLPPPLNVSDEHPATLDRSTAWTRERRQWVADADGGLAFHLGYAMGPGPSAWPLQTPRPLPWMRAEQVAS